MTATLIDYKPKFPKKAQTKSNATSWRTPKEIAEHFRTTEATVSRWGTLPINPLPRKKIGGKVLIDLHEADQWIKTYGTQY